MSQWYYKVLDQELGPVEFDDLAGLIHQGTLDENASVRRATNSDWERVQDVVGLLRAAKMNQEAPVESQPSLPERHEDLRKAADSPRQSRHTDPDTGHMRLRLRFSKWCQRPVTGKVAAFVGAAFFIVATAAIAGWWSATAPDFPHPRLMDPPIFEEGRAQSMRAAEPEVPTVPNLPKKKPTLLPGLEMVRPGFSPSLSEDLTTIVFSAVTEMGYDLFIASRNDVAKPFGLPRLIQAAQSPETEAYPALSPDGLDLVFVRSDQAPQLLRCRRKSVEEEFGEPAPLAFVGGWDDVRVGHPQFLDVSRLAVSRQEIEPPARDVLVSERAERDDQFSGPVVMPFNNPWPPYFIAANRLRAYYGTADGLFIAARRTTETHFEVPEVLLSQSVTGPIDGPIWVAPQEDVVIYCSPGPGQEPGSGRQLWMLRM